MLCRRFAKQQPVCLSYCISSNITQRRSRTVLTGDEYQYLGRKSVIHTMHFQKSLPRLPIPALEKSAQRYLNSLEPLVDNAAFIHTTKLVKEFAEGQGKELHDKLVARDKANKHTSYICEPWFDMYLRARVPIVLNYNPFMAFRPDARDEYNDQLIRASNMVISSLRFRRSLMENVLEPVVYHLNPGKTDSMAYRTFMSFVPEAIAWYASFLWKAYPLDMSQFKNLFNSTRIPEMEKDRLHLNPNAGNLVVVHKGYFYTMDVVRPDGKIRNAIEIANALAQILSECRDKPRASHALGALTTLNRDAWAQIRQDLLAAGNGEQLETIDSAIFVLALDDECEDWKKNRIAVAHTFLHGPAHNRWFDKSFQLIVNPAGMAAINFEHSWGDGVAVLRYFNDIFEDSTKRPQIHPDTEIEPNITNVKRIEFKLTDSLKSRIDAAERAYKETVSDLGIEAVEHKTCTRDFIKQQKLSPDSIFQLGFQLAYTKLYGKTPVTYESCSTSAFKHGRTETVRPATMATKRAVAAILAGKSSSEIRELVDECSRVHNQRTKEAALGQGFDRHLFALRLMALEKGGPLPAIFEDPSYAFANRFVLSTSTLHGEAFSAGGFAPVVPDGLGVAYGMPEKHLGVLVSWYKQHLQGDKFAAALDEAFHTIVNVLSQHSVKTTQTEK